MHTRAIVYPQGLPKRQVACDHCEELVLLCGGDPSRQFESEGQRLAEFASFLARLPAFRLSRVEALVVMTRTRPFELLLPTRRTLARHSPVLARAAWLVFWDHELDRDLPGALAAHGALDGAIERAPLWFAAGGEVFLVLSSRTRPEVLKARLSELRDDSAQSSRTRELGPPRRRERSAG